MNGSVGDNIFIIIVLFSFSVGTLVALTVYNEFNTTVRETFPDFNNSYVGNATALAETSVTSAFDYSFAFVFLGGNLIVIFLSWLVRAQPILVVFSIVGLFVMSVLAIFFGSAYTDFASSSQLGSVASHMPIQDFIMSNILALQLVFGFIDVIVLFGAGQGQAQGNQGGFNSV